MTDGDLVRRSAFDRYASGCEIWSPSDKWNLAKRRRIEAFCRAEIQDVAADASILNAGAGSHRYDWMPTRAVNLDRFEAQVSQLPNPVVGELEGLPFENAVFDVIVCVGSVLNYASAIEAVSELGRVLKPHGLMILHFETSDSAEHLGTPTWRAEAAPLRTLNNGKPDLVWVYSRAFIRRILARNGFRIERERGFHIGSALGLRLGIQQQSAATAAALDGLLRPIGFLADDVILMCRKSEG